MSDMVEKVARVLYEKNHPRDSSWSPWEALNPSEVGCYTDLARAAIEAMRSPPEYVLDAMNPSGRYASVVIPEAWNDAIDAILSEGE
jgi:hypothetical protein